jgi:putative flippase GtrA
MAPSIFNWLFLGIALLLYVGFSNPNIYIPAIAIPTLLSILSAFAWRFLVTRALQFRKNAIEVIREESKGIIPPKRHRKNS